MQLSNRPAPRRRCLTFLVPGGLLACLSFLTSSPRPAAPPAPLPLWWTAESRALHAAELAALSEDSFVALQKSSKPQEVFRSLSSVGNGLVRVVRYGPWVELICGDTEQSVLYTDLTTGMSVCPLGVPYLQCLLRPRFVGLAFLISRG